MQAQKIKKGTGLQKHLRDARRSINQFRKTPFFSLITVLIVMLTLVFPSLSVTAVLSLKSLVDLFSDEIELIAYVNTELSDEDALV
jgi:cell division protein FtsX